jgi:uncharacterized protein YodC (DUF2158 family)
MSEYGFKVGDVVTLKSGGPAMTVDEVLKMPEDSKGHIKCYWFDDRDQLKDGEFSPTSLELNEAKASDLATLLSAEDKG